MERENLWGQGKGVVAKPTFEYGLRMRMSRRMLCVASKEKQQV